MSQIDLGRPDQQFAHLYPPFGKVVSAALTMANAAALDPITRKPKFHGFSHYAMYEGYRSLERQEWLYEEGRTRPGHRVTNMRVPSYHGFGLAADIVPVVLVDGIPRGFSWDFPDDVWALWGHCARAHGLVWGGDWNSLKDLPHVQPKPATCLLWRPLARHFLRAAGHSTP
jgi:hypothetical protein